MNEFWLIFNILISLMSNNKSRSSFLSCFSLFPFFKTNMTSWYSHKGRVVLLLLQLVTVITAPNNFKTKTTTLRSFPFWFCSSEAQRLWISQANFKKMFFVLILRFRVTLLNHVIDGHFYSGKQIHRTHHHCQGGNFLGTTVKIVWFFFLQWTNMQKRGKCKLL